MGKKRVFTVTIEPYERLITLQEMADRCGIHPHLVEHLLRLGLIEPAAGCDDLFEPHVSARVQRIMRLHRDLDINFNGIALVLELLERIENLTARLQGLEKEYRPGKK